MRANRGPRDLKDGERCTVIGGTHQGKTGIVRDLNTSKSGQLTLTIVQANGDRFKTLARNVVRQSAETELKARP